MLWLCFFLLLRGRSEQIKPFEVLHSTVFWSGAGTSCFPGCLLLLSEIGTSLFLRTLPSA